MSFLLNHYKNYASDIIRNEYVTNSETEMVIDSLISNLSVSSIPSNFTFLSSDEIILMMRGSGNKMQLQLVDVKYMNEDCYKLITRNIPINLYTLEQIRNFRLFSAREPKFSLKLNPDIDKQELEKAQQLVLQRKK